MTKKQKATEEAHAILKNIADPSRLVKAAAILLKAYVERPGKIVVDESFARFFLFRWVQKQLDAGKYELVARFLWGREYFSAEARSVRMIWDVLPSSVEVVIIGAGAMGKSYSVAVWLLLDWIRDPEWTCIKVLSVTEEHAKRNVFAHLRNLFENSLVPLPGEKTDRTIQVNEDDKQGIHLMTIPSGEDGKGRLRGFHPVPRPVAHPQFGTLSRVRAILDEAEEIPGGVWEDVDNMLITVDGTEHVKIIAATNPKDRNSKLGQRCEPADGWTSVDIESSEAWKSKRGCDIIRLDGAKCENVAQRKIVFPGLLTWDGYERYLKGGDTTPEYFTMARGWFPEQGLHIAAIPLDFIDLAKGGFLFYGATTYCASVDLAFEGGDKAVMTIGRWGKVTGWTDHKGVSAKFKPDEIPEGGRWGLQIENQFELAKCRTVEMTNSIMRTCKSLHIGPEWLIVDRTGNGTGVHDLLRTTFGEKVMGLNFGTAATEKKILLDESQKADELYDGVVTELFFAVRKWIEHHYLRFGTSLGMTRLSPELTGRRYRQVSKGRVRIESKKEYKARGNLSPDFADSMTLLCHLVRMRAEFSVSMLANQPRYDTNSAMAKHSIVDNLEFVDMSEY